ncbi:MAG: FdhF/YdeP family oxidoreductase [Planctomycetota bacterium]|nr:MAG: FdhF/YdeP family oxidoreductase [Planctomycetota bacterium]
MLRIAWENRRALPWAWKVLNQGVCDGCALGTSGLRDWTIDGTHLCLVRLNLLSLNTMGPLDPARLADVAALSAHSSKELRALGRIPCPLRRRRGERGFTRVGWDELWADVGARWRAADPRRVGLFVTSRGITNEVYYTAQKVLRYLGSNNVDNSARLCHSPSGAGLKSTIGEAATTCSYRDWYEADLIVFLGSNPANDQPVAMKYLEQARARGARVVCVNAFREPGMQRYWVPSSPSSALFGTQMSDRTVLVKIGGDLAFLNAAAKRLLERGAVAHEFLAHAVGGRAEFEAALAAQPLDELLALAGVSREELEAFVDELARAERGVLVWSMGITQHEHGADTVRAIANLGLLREWVGRDGCGLMPIRGHSGVQGGAEMGCYASVFPGGVSIDAAAAARLSEQWGFAVPEWKGASTVDQLEAAGRGELDAFYCIGGNFLETLPEPERVAVALSRIGLRVHCDIVVTTQMLAEPGEVVYVLPSRTRYEQEGGGTETSTERRVIFSPELSGERIGDTRSEWRMLVEFAEAVRPGARAALRLDGGPAIRADIERCVPDYAGIAALARRGDQFQWGGRHLCAQRRFRTPDGRARLVPARPPGLGAARAAAWSARDGFVLATRRGKQFNSMVQRERDGLTGADRDHVFMHPEDARALGLAADQPIVLRNELGSYRGRVFLAEVARGTLQGHWPELNGLLAHGRVDPEGGVPDYNAHVRVEAG